MAEVHSKQGNYDEAMRLYDQALKIRMKALGPDHDDTSPSPIGAPAVGTPIP